MTKKILAIALAMIMIMLTGCVGELPDADLGAEAGGEQGAGQNRNDGFSLKATVTAVHKDYIEVEVIESDIAFGVYWVRTGVQTVYTSSTGGLIIRNDIKAGQTVEITYSGQIMMSYPPQIVALGIKVVG